MFCQKCGKELPIDSLFCSNCGEPLNNSSIIAEPSVNEIKKSAKSFNFNFSLILNYLKTMWLKFTNLPRKKIIAILLIFVFSLSLLYPILHKSNTEKIMELTNELAIAINEGDYEKMLSCFEPAYQKEVNLLMETTSSLLGVVDLKDVWAVGAINMSGNYETFIRIYDLDIDDDTAVMKLSIEFHRDLTMQEDVGIAELVKIDGDWYFVGDTLF